MAKYVHQFEGDIDNFLNYIKANEASLGISVSSEESHMYQKKDLKVSVNAYERYSWTGSNRVSLSVTIIGYQGMIEVVAISTGGSQAVLFKLNTFGEDSFLNAFKGLIDKYQP